MIPNLSVVVVFGLLFVAVAVVVQSAPIKVVNQENVHVRPKKQILELFLKNSDPVTTSTTTTTISTTINVIPESSNSISKQTNDEKKKRSVDELAQLQALLDDQYDADKEQQVSDDDDDDQDSYQYPYFQFNTEDDIDHKLHALTKETGATVHDKTNKPADTDDSRVFSDVKMSPNELIDIVRQRRHVNSNVGSNQRRKRALSAYDPYDNDQFYEPLNDLIERERFVRPSRAFAPLYWYPSVYQRNIRSALLYPSASKAAEWYDLYPDNKIDNDDDIDINQIPIFDDEENDVENDYELNRYPILLQAANNLFDNLQLQQQYNTDDLQVDDDDDEEEENDNHEPFFPYISPNNDDDEDDQLERQFYNYYHRPIETYY